MAGQRKKADQVWSGSKDLEPHLVEIGGLTLAPGARRRDQRALQSIATSLDEVGQRKLVVVQKVGKDLKVIAGNGTVEAAQALGWTHIARTMFDGTAIQAKVYGIADNRTGELATWDGEMLVAELRDLDKEGIDVEEALAFTVEEIEALVPTEGVERELDGPGGPGAAPEIHFTEELLESHNYVVLRFDNDVDWLQAQSVLGLSTVKALDSREGYQKQGISRVLDGPKTINKLMGGE